MAEGAIVSLSVEGFIAFFTIIAVTIGLVLQLQNRNEKRKRKPFLTSSTRLN